MGSESLRPQAPDRAYDARRSGHELKYGAEWRMVPANDLRKEPTHGPPDLDRRPSPHHRRAASGVRRPRSSMPSTSSRSISCKRCPFALVGTTAADGTDRGLAQGRRAGLHPGRGFQDAADPRARRQQPGLRPQQHPGDRQDRPDRAGAGDRRDAACVGHGGDLRRCRSGGLAELAGQARRCWQRACTSSTATSTAPARSCAPSCGIPSRGRRRAASPSARSSRPASAPSAEVAAQIDAGVERRLHHEALAQQLEASREARSRQDEAQGRFVPARGVGGREAS